MDKCPYCDTTLEEILQTGFVGCKHCYSEISGLEKILKDIYGDKKHKGKRIVHGDL
jgi:protein-arginine kinase activator protein McsA